MRYFRPSEYRCPCRRADCPAPREFSLEMAALLDDLRAAVGRPLYVNSGIRCPEHTKAVKGVTGSEHESGDGVDLRAETSQARFEVLAEAFRCQCCKCPKPQPRFRRVGVGKTFVHVGTSRAHPQNVTWLY